MRKSNGYGIEVPWSRPINQFAQCSTAEAATKLMWTWQQVATHCLFCHVGDNVQLHVFVDSTNCIDQLCWNVTWNVKRVVPETIHNSPPTEALVVPEPLTLWKFQFSSLLIFKNFSFDHTLLLSLTILENMYVMQKNFGLVPGDVKLWRTCTCTG